MNVSPNLHQSPERRNPSAGLDSVTDVLVRRCSVVKNAALALRSAVPADERPVNPVAAKYTREHSSGVGKTQVLASVEHDMLHDTVPSDVAAAVWSSQIDTISTNPVPMNPDISSQNPLLRELTNLVNKHALPSDEQRDAFHTLTENEVN